MSLHTGWVESTDASLAHAAERSVPATGTAMLRCMLLLCKTSS